MVGLDAECGGLEVTAWPFGGPTDATGFRAKGCLGTLDVKGGVADEEGGTDVAVWLFLFGSVDEAVAAGVEAQAKKAEVVGDGVPAGEDHDRWRGGVTEKVSGDSFRGRGAQNAYTLY